MNVRRQILRSIAFGVPALSLDAHAQDKWPSKPITIICSYPAGGGADVIARLLGGKMSELLGQPIVVDNRGGVAGQIGAGYVARSAPDGYTVLVDAAGFTINPSLYPKLPYDSKSAFKVVGIPALFPQVLVVTPSFEANSVADFVQRAKKGDLFFASSGTGSAQHIAGELFMESTGVKMTHIPYKGGAPALADVMGGQVPAFFSNIVSSLPLIQSGKVKALGVAGNHRVAAIPSVPTMQEQGIKGAEMYEWNGFFVAAKTPPEIIDRLAAAMDKALTLPDVKQKIESLGGEPFKEGRAQAAKFVDAEMLRMSDVVRRNSIKPE